MSSENTQFIINNLSIENESLVQGNQILPQPIGVAQTYVTAYQIPAEILDKTEQIFTIINQINQKKQQIVDLCTLGIGTFVPGEAFPTCLMESNQSNIISPVVSETGIIPEETSSMGGGSAGGTSTSVTTPQIAFGVVRRDSVRVQFYPRLEAQEAPNDNSLEGVSYPVLQDSSSSFAGKGKETILFINATFNDGAIDIRVWNNNGDWDTSWNGSDNVIGNYYKMLGGSGGGGSSAEEEDEDVEEVDCNALRNEVIQLENEIVNLRNQLPQYLNPINGLKLKKHGYQLKVWGYTRTQTSNSETIDINESIINILNNPPFTS